MALLDQILINESSNYERQRQQHESHGDNADFGSLEILVHQKSNILKVKLAVLAAEIVERFHLRDKNLERIAEDKYKGAQMVEKLSRDSLYRLREHKDKQPFYAIMFGLEKQIREEEVECWRDVVQVMRDFLEVWEACEMSKSRANFLNNAGP